MSRYYAFDISYISYILLYIFIMYIRYVYFISLNIPYMHK